MKRTIDGKEYDTNNLWYVGDPCYVIADDKWSEFCDKTFCDEAKALAHDYWGDNGYHCDSIIEWGGEQITIWRNGGDGTWEFIFASKAPLNAHGRRSSFGVDAGIFAVMPLEILDIDSMTTERLMDLGMIFDRQPVLYVADDIVYVNNQHDDSVAECPDFRCRRIVHSDEIETCENGTCEGCYSCFDCDCEDEEE